MKSCKTSLWRVISFLTLCIPLVFMLAFSGQALAVCPDSGFEDEDGNLVFDETCFVGPDSELDWNDFAPIEWTDVINPFPYRTADEVFSGWTLTGLEDDQANNSDTAFAGGTKQDDECPAVKGGKAPNKDDLKQVYISSNTIDGDVFLNLAWVRIPQNTTSPSAHIGFEFNQGEIACGGNSDDLVERTVGDMLIVYDFEGGATDTPTITLRRWVDSGACEVGSNSPPCWGPSINLTALGFAEARVNTSLVGPVDSALAPPTPPATMSVAEELQLNEFGEAGINLTDAGVFDQNVCLGFGTAFAVSRSSGNSAQAQMKDLVGPGDVNIANCGRVIIRKVTEPSPDSTDTSFAYTTTGGLDPATFNLKDGEAQDYGVEVFAGMYSVTETDPDNLGFDFVSLDCSASDDTNGTTIDLSVERTVSFDLKPLDTVDCTYTNRARADLTIRKEILSCDDDGGQFAVSVDGTDISATLGDPTVASLIDGDTEGPNELAVGTYTVREVVQDAYVAVHDSGLTDCEDAGNGVQSINLAGNDDKTCTFLNVRKPRVTVIKEIDGTAGTFDLFVGTTEVVSDAGDQSEGSTLIHTLVNGNFGTPTVSEVGTNGTNTGDYSTIIQCDDGTSGAFDLAPEADTNDVRSVTLGTLQPGDHVTCRIINISPDLGKACLSTP